MSEDSDDFENDPIYCLLCGACGESGCCPPSLCKGEGGLYCDLYNPKRGFYELSPFMAKPYPETKWKKRIFVIGMDLRLNVVFEQDNMVIERMSKNDLANYYEYKPDIKGWQ